MTRGPKPQPTALKLIRGNPGKRPLPKNEAMPDLVLRLPEPPSFLSAHGRDEWRRMGARLLALGLLTVIDTSSFAAYCAMWGHYAQAEDDLAALAIRDPSTHGKVIRGPDGKMHRNPLWTVLLQAHITATRMALEFGMTPSARTRLGVVVSPSSLAAPAPPSNGPQTTGTDRFFTR